MSGVPEVSLWNIVVGLLLAPVAYFLKQTMDRLSKTETLLTATRENIFQNYYTKDDFKQEVQRVLDRFDKLEAKLDRVIQETRHDAS